MLERIKNLCMAFASVPIRSASVTMRLTCVATLTLTLAAPAFAQQADLVLRVDIVNGTVTGDGSDWDEDAFKFLQDALSKADDHHVSFPNDVIDIWVASGGFDGNGKPIAYRPDQGGPDSSCFQGSTYCARCCSFRLRNNVRILGGFPEDPHTLHGGNGADINDRDWEANITVLSGDLNNDDAFCQRFDPNGPYYNPDCGLELNPVDYLEFNNYGDNSFHVVRATSVSATAVLDGFVVRGGVVISGAQPRFRDCVFVLHEGAAVRCFEGSEVMFHRCTFTGVACGALVVDEGSRIALVACEPGEALGDVQRSGIADVSACSELIAVDATQ